MQDNRESINKKNAPEGKSAENRKLFFWRIAASVLFLAVIALGLLLLLPRSEATAKPEEPVKAEEAEKPAEAGETEEKPKATEEGGSDQ